ncbi:hypothetical protein [Alkalicoccus daliensis]|uniref:Uncharacterized protein n=1 Tax=Alkalicoccus daliensis TaxID=745820 RepID=A0A1G9ZXS1_9BACI|nr:hypothetical protein [Alkalicoccus daliensis]SDN25894.1 hypothetical protein SAMN04488053_101273 [Alkalicoccus daliensis]
MEGLFPVWGWWIYAGIIIFTVVTAVMFLINKKYTAMSAFVVPVVLITPFVLVMLIIEAPYPVNEALFIYQEVINFNWQALLFTAMNLFIIIWWTGLLFHRRKKVF